MFDLEIEDNVIKVFKKLSKKNPQQLEAINKKIEQIRNNPKQFKPLKWPMINIRRVHIGSFVLVYEIYEKENLVKLLDYEHHDKIYK